MLSTLLACALLAAPQDPAELLPPAPEGWRFERLEFPLQFAPDLPLAGFEELRFAPGMFDPDAPTYFSYVLAIRAEGRVEMDAAFLEDLLLRYYRGLTASVAEGRGLELDLAGVAARVAPGAHGFVAEVDLFDAFTTGDPLRLQLELSVHQGATSTELFGIASPAARGSEAWRSLRSMGRAWRASRAESTYFNHVYVVVDDVAFEELRASPWLTEHLGVSEERTTTQGGSTYTGLYLYGGHTYFEFVRADASQGFQPGDSGVAFGFERPGGTARAAERLHQHEVNSFAGRRTRGHDEASVPWFEILGVERPTTTSRLNLFSLEYVPEFLAGWHAELSPRDASITRHDVLARYAATLDASDRRAQALLGDVVAVQLALDADERGRFEQCALALGLEVEEREGVLEVRGPAQRYVIEPSDRPGRVTGFDLTLTRELPAQSMQLGPFDVELEGRRARFRRRPQER